MWQPGGMYERARENWREGSAWQRVGYLVGGAFVLSAATEFLRMLMNDGSRFVKGLFGCG